MVSLWPEDHLLFNEAEDNSAFVEKEAISALIS